jgi:CheY-like chemotaxis protein
MVLGVAKQSGGTVEIETELGHGTSVRVYLPRARSEGADRRRPLETAAAAAPLAARVLLVDDDFDVREVTSAQLAALGCIVTEAPNGHAALELIDQHGPDAFDLLISDFAMPGMTGADLARAARERKPGLPVLLITGYADAKAGGAAGESEWGWLPKPFRQSELADQVRRALGREPSGSASNVVALKPPRG